MKRLKNPILHHLLPLFPLLFILPICQSSSLSSIEVNSYTQGIGADSIRGKVKINDQFYTVICDCDQKDDQENVGPTCDPSKLKIMEDRAGKGASFDAVRNLIGHPSDLEYTDVLKSSFHCLDGRVNKAVLGTLGGDMGEFILGLMIYRSLLGSNVTWDQANIDNYFTSYLRYMQHGTFVMCTDDNSISHLEKEISVEGLNLNNPNPQIQKEVLESLTSAENNGDTHLRMLLKYPGMYAIDANLVKMAIKAFYKVLWDKKNTDSTKLQLEILVGDHQESAFLEVRSNESCTKARLAPLIKPRESKKDGLSIFVNHMDAVSIRRVDLAKFFTTYLGHHREGLEPNIFYNRMKHHGLAFLEITGSYVAKNLPFYSINIM